MSGEGKPQIVSSPQDDLSEAAEDARPDVSSETDTSETKTTDAPPADSGTDPAPDPEPAAKPRRWRRRMWKSGVWLVALLALFAAAAMVLLDKRLDAPQWLRAEAERRIERHLGGLQIEFGEIELVVHSGWRPRLSLRDVTLFYPDGSPAVHLEDAQAALAMRPLLRGQLRPKLISLSGLFATLETGRDGAVALSFSDGATPLRQARNLPQLIDTWDRQLELPILSAVTRVETQSVTLNYIDRRIDRAWTLDGGAVLLSREGDSVNIDAGFSVLSGREYASTVDANYRSDIGDTAAEFAVVVDQVPSVDIASQSPAFGWLDVLRAPISGALRGAVDSDGKLLPLTASLEIGTGVIQPNDQLKPVPLQSAQSFFTFDPARQELAFTRLSVESGWVSGQMEGRAELVGVRDGRLTQLVGQLSFSDLKVNPLRLYPDPLAFSGVQADFLMELQPFRLRLGEALVQQGDTDLLLRGEVRAGAKGWSYDLQGSADQLDVAMVKEMWPPSAPPKPRAWFSENVLAGDIRDAQFALRGRDAEKPFVAVDLGFENGTVRFNKFYPLLKGAAGQLSIYGKRLVVTATEGGVTARQGGQMDLAGTSFIIPDTSLKGDNSLGILRAELKGSALAALSLLNREPLTILSNVGLPVGLGSGEVELSATASMPLKKKLDVAEVDYHYAGQLRRVASDVLVPGYPIAADALSISGDNSHVTVSGPGTFAGVPIRAKWRQGIRPGNPPDGTIEGHIELSPRTLKALNIGLPDGMVSGSGRAILKAVLPPGEPVQLSVNSDLKGVGLRLAELGWSKSEGSAGRLSFNTVLQKTPSIENLVLEATGLRAAGRVTVKPDGGLDQAQFSSVSLGGWLQGPVTLRGRGNATPSLSMTGGWIDLERAPFSSRDEGRSAGGGGSNTPISLAIDRLQVTQELSLSRFQGRFDTLGGFNGSFTGNLNTLTPVEGVVVPQAGGLAMRLRSADAGGVFRAAEVMRDGYGGSFEMTMVPAVQPGEYNGQLRVNNIRVKNTPTIAALINSLSLVGLFDELSGQGILFTSMEADFRLGSRYLTLVNSSAVGPSIGLSMDGVYDLTTSQMNMRGVLSPIYLVNAIGSVLTRKGEGLFGFSFTVKGKAADPVVSVNPLSGIAPGFLREIFRGEAPKAPGATPPPKEERRKTAEELREERIRRREAR
ncbi:AsmA-like C-terminal region-containing protein [Tritonibacter mobilis]|uniref:YhdP family protein n=1 Tax=Tritonibacter mobilis TaxID=379347 RepID=UPI00398FCC9B